jgi:hypothetical protein
MDAFSSNADGFCVKDFPTYKAVDERRFSDT